MTLPTAHLDARFADELDEIIERALLRYRPLLCHLMTGHFRINLKRAISFSPRLGPTLDVSRPEPVQGAGSLTAAQVSLLGGTRPTRLLHGVAFELGLRLDGGDPEGARYADHVLLNAHVAMENLARHHVVAEEAGAKARGRELRQLVRLGIAAQLAAVAGALREQWPEGGEGEEPSDVVRRYFLGALRAFGQLRLSRKDQEIFRDYYIDGLRIEELLDERDVELDAEVARRLGLLKRLATALEAHLDVLSGALRPHEPGVPEALAGAAPRALKPGAGPAARPRKR